MVFHMTINRGALSSLRESRQKELDKRNPLVVLTQLVNYYHSIDLMEGTDAEKQWAKDRLYKKISDKMFEARISRPTRSKIFASLKNKRIWEEERDRLV